VSAAFTAWRVEEDYGCHVIREARTDGEFDGYIASTWGGPHSKRANLIAAAPELLEALRAFMALDRDFSAASDRHLREIVAEQRASAPLVKAVIAARAAIAKATGAA
jgi:hypothetical protein